MSKQEIEAIASECLRLDHATHLRRCAIAAEVREVNELQAMCDHDWDMIRLWCRKCGIGVAYYVNQEEE